MTQAVEDKRTPNQPFKLLSLLISPIVKEDIYDNIYKEEKENSFFLYQPFREFKFLPKLGSQKFLVAAPSQKFLITRMMCES